MGKTLSKTLRMMGKARHTKQVETLREGNAPRSKTWGGRDTIHKERRDVSGELRKWRDV